MGKYIGKELPLENLINLRCNENNQTSQFNKKEFKFCSQCGTKLDYEDKFCSQCGNKL